MSRSTTYAYRPPVAVDVQALGHAARRRLNVLESRPVIGRNRRADMTNRHVFGFVTIVAGILGVVGLLKITAVRVAGQTRTAGATIMTSWGEPDLQGIWYQTY